MRLPPSSCLFSVTINSLDDVIAHAHFVRIFNEARIPVQGESRQQLKSIEISFNSNHCGKIALYLDRIHQYQCLVKFL